MERPDTTAYSRITSRCFINAPCNQLLDGLIDLFLQYRLQPEIGLEGDWLWDMPKEQFLKLAKLLEKHHLACTLHAPFFDLAPGGFDKKILALTREKLQIAFDLLAIFQPRSIVCHLGYEANKHQGKCEVWQNNALATWRHLVAQAAGCGVPVMFENTYETEPSVHGSMLERINSPFAGFCLDTGHLLAFAKSPWQPWITRLAPFLGQLHLHDNQGDGDQHLAIGKGVFPFQELFDFLRIKGKRPLCTLEPHSEKDLWDCLEALERMQLLHDF